MSLQDILEELSRKKLPRSHSVVAAYVRNGRLRPVRTTPKNLGQLFTRDAFDEFCTWLSDDQRDGWLRRFARPRFRGRWTLGCKAAVLFRKGYSTTEAADELGYTADYVAKLWKGREVTAAVQRARDRRRILAQLPESGVWIDLRDVYRALTMPAADAEALIEDLQREGVLERATDGRRRILHRVSEKPD
jgi:hypothetical protein